MSALGRIATVIGQYQTFATDRIRTSGPDGPLATKRVLLGLIFLRLFPLFGILLVGRFLAHLNHGPGLGVY